MTLHCFYLKDNKIYPKLAGIIYYFHFPHFTLFFFIFVQVFGTLFFFFDCYLFRYHLMMHNRHPAEIA